MESAIEIYNAAYGVRSERDSKTFFLLLVEAVTREFEKNGYCTLIDAMLESDNFKKMDAIVWSALLCVLEEYKGIDQAALKTGNYVSNVLWTKYNETVYFSWDNYSYCLQYCVSVNESIISKIKELRKLGQARHLASIKKLKDKIKQNETVSQIVSKEQNLMFSDEQREADSIRKKAENDAERMLANAQREAEETLASAQREAGRIRAAARQDAENMREEAKRGADAISREAEQNRVKVLAQARQEALTIQSQAGEYSKTVAKERTDELVRKYMTKAQEEFKRENSESVSQMITDDRKMIKSVDELHQEMCDATNTLQAEWIKALDGLKTDLYKHLRNWQVALYPRGLKQIAENFTMLYRIVNIDKVICEEILFQETEAEHPSAVTIEKLQKLNRKLTTLLRKYEMALKGFDLYLYYPKADEIFDEVYHTLDDSEMQYEDAEMPYEELDLQIAEWVVPGVVKKYDNGDEDVLVRSAVRVKK